MKVRAMLRFASILGAISTALAGFAQTIFLKAAEFDPCIALPVIRERESDAIHDPLEPAHILIQLHSPATSNDILYLESINLNIVAYVPQNAWVVEGTLANLPALTQWHRVRWAGQFEPGYKFSTELGRRTFKTPERITEILFGQRRATITVFDGKSPESILESASKKRLEVLDVSRMGPRWVVEIRGSLANLKSMASLHDVAFIEEAVEVATRNDITAWVIQSNLSAQMPIWNKGIHGEGQIAGLIDSALYKAHNCFTDPAVGNVPGPSHRKLVAYFSSSGTNGSSSHGTHTAGTLGGDQQPISGSIYRNGMAYKNRIAFTNLSDTTSANLYQQFLAMHNVGARDYSNSWGDDGTTAYTAHCQAIDQFSWDFEDDMVAFAVTNQSSLKTPENAKSVLGVGNTQQSPNQANHSSGGTGPTSDGRRKPEIYAPGTGIYSARNGTTDQWRSSTGTSMACPAIAGAAQLVRQYYRDGWLNRGIAGGPSLNPSGALIRATLMNGGVNMTGVTGYPSNQEGWGRLMLDDALWFSGESLRSIVRDVRRSGGLVQGSERVLKFTVVDPSLPLRITMSFTDYPPAAFVSFAPVNNVNLTVNAPGGLTYLGNQINTSTGVSVTGGAADAINSTEMVLFSAPTKGTYTVRVNTPTVAQGGTQGYAVVVSGGIAPFQSIGP